MLMTYKASLGPSINKVCVKKGVESKKTEQVKGRVNSDEKTEHTSEEKKKKGNHLISSCCLTFLFGHFSHCHGCLSLLVLRDLKT